jgi:hypothetical protein
MDVLQVLRTMYETGQRFKSDTHVLIEFQLISGLRRQKLPDLCSHVLICPDDYVDRARTFQIQLNAMRMLPAKRPYLTRNL